jgi:hypothetical protein
MSFWLTNLKRCLKCKMHCWIQKVNLFIFLLHYDQKVGIPLTKNFWWRVCPGLMRTLCKVHYYVNYFSHMTAWLMASERIRSHFRQANNNRALNMLFVGICFLATLCSLSCYGECMLRLVDAGAMKVVLLIILHCIKTFGRGVKIIQFFKLHLLFIVDYVKPIK